MALTGDFLFFRLNGEIQTPLCEVFLELIPLVSSKVIVRNVSTRIINKISEKCFLLINGTCEFYSLHYFLVPAAIFASLAGKYLCKPLFPPSLTREHVRSTNSGMGCRCAAGAAALWDIQQWAGAGVMLCAVTLCLHKYFSLL